MRGNRLRLLIVGVIIVTLIGFVFFRGPTPDIKIKPETLYSIGIINITNTMVTSWIVVALMVSLVFLLSRRWELVPRGAQNVLEAIIEAFYNLVVGIAGEKNGRRFFPAVATIFFFVLFANWFSLFPIFNAIGLGEETVLPAEETAGHVEEGTALAEEVVEEEHEESGFIMETTDLGPLPITWVGFSSLSQLQGLSIEGDDPEALQKAQEEREKGNFVGEIKPFLRGVNTDLNTPLALAIVSAIFVEFWGITAVGFRTYGSKFVNLGGIFRGIGHLSFGEFFQGFIDAFVGFLEFVSEVVRLISFTFRLFGNMFAGEVVILMFTFMVPLFIPITFYFLEMFVGLIQAFIFAVLTLAFGMMAVSHGGHEPEEAPAVSHHPEGAEI
jgi:F-type H+-transporting ATPase subunit a